MVFGLNKGFESHPDFRARFEEEPEPGLPRRPAGLSWEAWDLLDPALQEALLEGRLAPEELHELAGWLRRGGRPAVTDALNGYLLTTAQRRKLERRSREVSLEGLRELVDDD